jgi:hypothetical protein
MGIGCQVQHKFFSCELLAPLSVVPGASALPAPHCATAITYW